MIHSSTPQPQDQRDLVRKARIALSRVITRDVLSRDALAEAVQLLEAVLAQPQVMEEWLPIESAPKGRAVIVYCGGAPGAAKMSVARMENGKWFITAKYLEPSHEFIGGGVKCPNIPTHWMPLPEPPTSALTPRPDGERG